MTVMEQTISSSSVSITTIPPNNEKDTTKLPPKSRRRFVGIFLSLVSSFAFSLNSLLVKILPAYHPFLIGVWRFLGLFFITLPFLIYAVKCQHRPVFYPACSSRKTSLLLCARWFFGSSAIALQLVSLKYINIADSLVITFATPVFVTVAAHKILGEECGIVPLMTAAMAIVGVVILAKPPILTGERGFALDVLVGVGFATASMICTGISFLLMRYLRTIHFSFMVTFLGLWGSLECLLLSWGVDALILPRAMSDYYFAIGIGLLSFVGQGSLTLALKFEEASIVSVVKTMDVAFGFMWQIFFLNMVPDVYSIIGGTLVVSGVLVIGFRKWLIQLPDSHPARGVCCVLLK